MDNKQQEEAIKKLPNPDTMKYVLMGHYGVIRH